MSRKWFVHATPRPGHHPPDATTDPVTGNANKVIVGPFDNVMLAATFVTTDRPYEYWRTVAIHSVVKEDKP